MYFVEKRCADAKDENDKKKSWQNKKGLKPLVLSLLKVREKAAVGVNYSVSTEPTTSMSFTLISLSDKSLAITESSSV